MGINTYAPPLADASSTGHCASCAVEHRTLGAPATLLQNAAMQPCSYTPGWEVRGGVTAALRAGVQNSAALTNVYQSSPLAQLVGWVQSSFSAAQQQKDG